MQLNLTIISVKWQKCFVRCRRRCRIRIMFSHKLSNICWQGLLHLLRFFFEVYNQKFQFHDNQFHSGSSRLMSLIIGCLIKHLRCPVDSKSFLFLYPSRLKSLTVWSFMSRFPIPNLRNKSMSIPFLKTRPKPNPFSLFFNDK